MRGVRYSPGQPENTTRITHESAPLPKLMDRHRVRLHSRNAHIGTFRIPLQAGLEKLVGVGATYRLKLTCTPADEAPTRSAILDAIAARPEGIRLVGLAGQLGDAGLRVVTAELHSPHANDPAVERFAAGLLVRESVGSVGWDRMNGRPT